MPKKDLVVTRWAHFARAKVRPIKVLSKGYGPVHRTDQGSHTKIPPTPQHIIDNICHGGGFYIELEPCEDMWEGWDEFRKAGVEITDFRSKVNGDIVPVHPQYIQKYMRPHISHNRRMEKGGRFYITLSREAPIIPQEEVFSEEVPA